MTLRNIPGSKRARTYSPTIAGQTNCDALPTVVSPFVVTFVGEGVQVSGQISVDPTAISLVTFRVSLPTGLKTPITNVGQITGNCGNDVSNGEVIGNIANNTAEVRFLPTSAAIDTISVNFSYLN